MSLAPGTRLGPYEIVAPLAEGGMGQVYRARDERLHRDVAVKVLPPDLACNPDRLRRFEREARAAGMLNHPNIVAIHDVGTHEGAPYVVSELLPGATLRETMAFQALPLRKAVEIARGIANGLAAAHEKGIVHRDLKPENVFVLPDGRVKLLDFGLAKLTERDGRPAPSSATKTDPGLIVGTLGYMSPEQVRGDEADFRSDIFGLGAILYEMATGERPFLRPTPVETLHAILKEEPEALARETLPAELARVVRHCLEKNPAERFQSARDLAFHLESLASAAAPAPRPRAVTRPRIGRGRPAAAAAVALGAGLLAGRFLFAPRSVPPPSFMAITYSGTDADPSASPDGTAVAFASSRGDRPRIWLENLAGGGEVPLTDGDDFVPRFSPDGAEVLFARRDGARYALYRVPVLGGAPRRVVDDAYEGDWSPDGRSVAFLRFLRTERSAATAILVASAEGGGLRQVALLPNAELTRLRWSPDGKRMAAVLSSATGTQAARILLLEPSGANRRVVELPTSAGDVTSMAFLGDGRELLVAAADWGSNALGLRSLSGRIHRVDAGTGAVTPLLSIPSIGSGIDVLGPGRLVFSVDASGQSLREDSIENGVAKPGRWLTRGISVDRQPVYSPDGGWVAFTAARNGNLDILAVSTANGVIRRLTEDAAEDWDPVFTRDGTQLVFSSRRPGHFEVFAAAADGSGPRQVTHDGVDAENPTVTPDGRWVVYASGNPEHAGLWKMPLDGGGEPARLGAEVPIHPELSPDGRYVAYHLPLSDRGQVIHVVRFDDGSLVPFEIRTGGGRESGRLRWMPDGRAIAFIAPLPGAPRTGILVQDFAPGRDTSDTRRVLGGFDADDLVESFGISPDGKRLTLSALRGRSTLMVVDGVPGVTARQRP